MKNLALILIAAFAAASALAGPAKVRPGLAHVPPASAGDRCAKEGG